MQYYGQVLFYFWHRYDEKDHFLAFVKYFREIDEVYGFHRVLAQPCQPDKLETLGGGGYLEVINIGVIDCPVGMMKGDEKEPYWWILDRLAGRGATFDLARESI
jgi:hypothetical protein